MSCQILEIARITNLHEVKKLLGSSLNRVDTVSKDELPLQDVLVSLSSARDILVIALNTKIIILASKWNLLGHNDANNEFCIIWSDEIAMEPNEWITSISCFPITILEKSSARGEVDWTCVCVGFSTGFIKFYTEDGVFLMKELFHDEPVLAIKCQSRHAPKYTGDVECTEEVHVLYGSTICILQGFSLFSVLRALKCHLQRARLSGTEEPPAVNLVLQKWGFKNQDVTNDSKIIGATTFNLFDHLMTASISGGYNALYRSSAFQYNLIVATGKRPFIGFHYTTEKGFTPVLSNIAASMASKLVTTIGTAVPVLNSMWFRGTSKAVTSLMKGNSVAKEAIERMTCRFGLSDAVREGLCIVAAPVRTFCVVSDTMGRVILVDTKRGLALRMWKGYRNAQCGWTESIEERQSSTQGSQLRTTLFLVVYAPKKGIIDIWSVQQDLKIATFSASKHGRLLYIDSGLFGLNDRPSISEKRSRCSCIFIDPTGYLKEITVPFHSVLNEKHGHKAHDLHLLKKLKRVINRDELDDEKLQSEVVDTCARLKSIESMLRTIKALMTSRHVTPSVLLAASRHFVDKFKQHPETFDPMTKSLFQLSTQLQRATEFYIFTRSQFERTSSPISGERRLFELLLVSEEELQRILSLLEMSADTGNVTVSNRVTFKEDRKTFAYFLSSFQIGTPTFVDFEKDEFSDKLPIVSELVYRNWMDSTEPVNTWHDAAAQSGIRPQTLLRFALIYWLNRTYTASLAVELKRFIHLIHSICSIAGTDEVCAKDNEVSTWWHEVRGMLTECSKPFNSLTAAMACRAVSITLEKKRDLFDQSKRMESHGVETMGLPDTSEPEGLEKQKYTEKESSSNDALNTMCNLKSDWETVSKDGCQFTVLISHLEDLTILDYVVSRQPPRDHTGNFLSLRYEKENVSLRLLLSGGKGSVSEIVARWLASTGLHPTCLIDSEGPEIDRDHSLESSLNVTVLSPQTAAVRGFQDERIKLFPLTKDIGAKANVDVSTNAETMGKIALLKLHFPYSLASDVLLANLCWRFVTTWIENPTRLKVLDAALTVLRHIPTKIMQQGLCCLLWTLHLKKMIKAASKLMNKLGKLPNERLCMQTIGLSDMQLTMFLQHCVTFLDIFLDATVLDGENNVTVKFEDLWESSQSGPKPLVELITMQTPVSYDLVLLHFQLVSTLHMMAYFNIKVQKPLDNLFQSTSRPYFFQDMTSGTIFTWYHDNKQDAFRMEFLHHVITASTNFIHREAEYESSFGTSQVVFWMSKCHTLASIWKINTDELRVHQVQQLYANGFDRLAEEAVTAVNNTQKLADVLLPIAGKRIKAYLSKTLDILNKVSRVNPALTKYLDSLDSFEGSLTDYSDNDTIELVRLISRFVDETDPNYRLAQLLLDATLIYEEKL
ncbi:rab3 GTPase-activating protein non-catalytic subunit isoform X2 [Orussus abietinus]|uniref:rab3 GTPase-activating protein non-catalytic subunit isoform X2 n=1 Tax=Orussus abietinus TaxID=222816 RepID=UPI000C715BC2|nr:rab3 GTPase-activating protein non-catalytic subunit isoform X2 [Orussus abietinus]